MNVNPGELDKRIQIISIDKQTGNETIVRKCWASIKNTTGSEIKTNDIEISDVKTRFLVRYSRTEITDKMKIKYNHKIYNIVYVNNYNESNAYLEILAEYKGEKYEG